MTTVDNSTLKNTDNSLNNYLTETQKSSTMASGYDTRKTIRTIKKIVKRRTKS